MQAYFQSMSTYLVGFWVFTDATNDGSTTFIGEVVRDYQKDYVECGQILSVGISPCANVRYTMKHEITTTLRFQ